MSLVGLHTSLHAFVMSWAFVSFALLMLCIGALACVCVDINVVACMVITGTYCVYCLPYGTQAYVCLACNVYL